jgi:hypothetical protein
MRDVSKHWSIATINQSSLSVLLDGPTEAFAAHIANKYSLWNVPRWVKLSSSLGLDVADFAKGCLMGDAPCAH